MVYRDARTEDTFSEFGRQGAASKGMTSERSEKAIIWTDIVKQIGKTAVHTGKTAYKTESSHV